jgi:hypothetical protein
VTDLLNQEMIKIVKSQASAIAQKKADAAIMDQLSELSIHSSENNILEEKSFDGASLT